MNFSHYILIVVVLFSFRNKINTQSILNQNNSSKTIFYSIKKFVDGDTFWINDGSQKGIKIRLIGVDTPENQSRFGKQEEYFGDEASFFVKKILTHNHIRLEFDIDSLDSFGRTLAYVYLDDGTFINEKLVKEGFAKAMCVSPNIRYKNHFKSLEKIALKNKIGLWKDH